MGSGAWLTAKSHTGVPHGDPDVEGQKPPQGTISAARHGLVLDASQGSLDVQGVEHWAAFR
jgi:hypothetical protein